MTKKEMVRRIATEVNAEQTLTKRIVQRCLDMVVDVVCQTGRIELRNFGVFEVKRRAARRARNPRTGTEVEVPAKNIVTFKPGKEMLEKIRV